MTSRHRGCPASECGKITVHNKGLYLVARQPSQISMSHTTLNNFLSRATASPYAFSLGLGLGTVTYYFWGNVASQVMGAISIPIHPKDRKKLGIDMSKGVEIWAWAYKLGAVSRLSSDVSRDYGRTHFGFPETFGSICRSVRSSYYGCRIPASRR